MQYVIIVPWLKATEIGISLFITNKSILLEVLEAHCHSTGYFCFLLSLNLAEKLEGFKYCPKMYFNNEKIFSLSSLLS